MSTLSTTSSTRTDEETRVADVSMTPALNSTLSGGESWHSNFETYLTSKASPGREGVLGLLRSTSAPDEHTALLLDACKTWEGDFGKFLETLFLDPERILCEADQVLRKACQEVYDEVKGEDGGCSLKEKVSVIKLQLVQTLYFYFFP